MRLKHSVAMWHVLRQHLSGIHKARAAWMQQRHRDLQDGSRPHVSPPQHLQPARGPRTGGDDLLIAAHNPLRMRAQPQAVDYGSDAPPSLHAQVPARLCVEWLLLRA